MATTLAAGSAADHAASGAMDWRLHEVRRGLQEAKHAHINWHTILNNHASTRPGEHGGKLCASVKACKEFFRVGLNGHMHRCRLVLPHSYAPEDGIVTSEEAVGSTRREADENACLAVLVRLVAGGLPYVLLRPPHWNVPIEVLYDFLRRIVDPSAAHQPLAVHQRDDVPGPTERPTEMTLANLERAAEMVRVCLRSPGGYCNPSRMNHKLIEQTDGPQQKVYGQIAGLIPKGAFRNFVEQHPDFETYAEYGNHWGITWRSSESASAGPQLAMEDAASWSAVSWSAASGAPSAPASSSAVSSFPASTASAASAPAAFALAASASAASGALLAPNECSQNSEGFTRCILIPQPGPAAEFIQGIPHHSDKAELVEAEVDAEAEAEAEAGAEAETEALRIASEKKMISGSHITKNATAAA